MSDKPDSLSRRGFFRRFRSQEHHSDDTEISDDQTETQDGQTDRRGFMRVVRNGLVVLGLGGLLSGGDALAQPSASRFKLLNLINPNVSGNYAPRQNAYSILPPDLQPHLWPSDDVRNKDRFPRTKLDKPSPSISFEAMKMLQKAVKSRLQQIKERLDRLSFIRRNSNNFKHAVNPKHRLHERHKKLKWVYDREYKMNSDLAKIWGNINDQMEALRKAVKKTVMLEVRACRGLRRCAKKQPDISYGTDFLNVALFVTSPRPNGGFNTYTSAKLTRKQQLEGFHCADIQKNATELGIVTNSRILEDAKLLERVITTHVAAVDEREQSYLDIEKKAKDIKDKSGPRLRLKRQLIRIYTRGRKHNEGVRKSWNAILNKVTLIKGLIAFAEKEEASLADDADRCATK